MMSSTMSENARFANNDTQTIFQVLIILHQGITKNQPQDPFTIPTGWDHCLLIVIVTIIVSARRPYQSAFDIHLSP